MVEMGVVTPQIEGLTGKAEAADERGRIFLRFEENDARYFEPKLPSTAFT